jgi:formylglycine-generating enzyme required for sulfatase activity
MFSGFSICDIVALGFKHWSLTAKSDKLHPMKDVMDWIEVAGGWFEMGGGPRSNENPQHRVWVDPFRLARTQVTRGDYQLFLDATRHPAPDFWSKPALAAGPRLPAVGPSWDDAMAYCLWASLRYGETLRLPSEAEWEYAACDGQGVVYPWGDDPPESLPDYAERWLTGPEPVDLYPSLHPRGFLGLGENVHEWCSDWYDADYYSVSPQRNPPGAESGRRRSSRGGAWRHAVKVSRCAGRSSIPPDRRYEDYGFRLAAPRGRLC